MRVPGLSFPVNLPKYLHEPGRYIHLSRLRYREYFLAFFDQLGPLLQTIASSNCCSNSTELLRRLIIIGLLWHWLEVKSRYGLSTTYAIVVTGAKAVKAIVATITPVATLLKTFSLFCFLSFLRFLL